LPDSPDPSRSPSPLWPPDLGIIDTLIGFPADPSEVYAGVRRGLRDRESLEDFEMPAGYMFRDPPAFEDKAVDARLDSTLAEMDRFGIAIGLVSLSSNQDVTETAVTRYPDRFVGSWTVDPNTGMDGIRALVRAHERWGLRAVSFMPHGMVPQVAIDAPLAYVYYAKCVELDLPAFITVGIAGPRVPSMAQHVERLDQVLYDFPDLVVVMRHGAEPWTDLAVKLMLKWPNLYYSTSAFAPKYYPKPIIDFANTRGAHKVMYAGYFPMGLTLERIFAELPGVPLRSHVWPRFLRNNAAAVLKLGDRQ
jgi:uncharacterized protein